MSYNNTGEYTSQAWRRFLPGWPKPIYFPWIMLLWSAFRIVSVAPLFAISNTKSIGKVPGGIIIVLGATCLCAVAAVVNMVGVVAVRKHNASLVKYYAKFCPLAGICWFIASGVQTVAPPLLPGGCLETKGCPYRDAAIGSVVTCVFMVVIDCYIIFFHFISVEGYIGRLKSSFVGTDSSSA